MNSARPCRTTTVPLRPGGGAQRAKRKLTPSEVLITPVTASSGTGLAGVETRFMKKRDERCALRAYSRVATALNAGCAINKKDRFFNILLTQPEGLRARKPPPYHGCAGLMAAHG